MTFLNPDRPVRDAALPASSGLRVGRFGVLAARLIGFFEAARQDRIRRRPIRSERSAAAWDGSPYKEILNRAGVWE